MGKEGSLVVVECGASGKVRVTCGIFGKAPHGPSSRSKRSTLFIE